MRRRPLVLVINGSEDMLAALSELLQMEGYRTHVLRQPDIERGRVDVAQVVRECEPACLVYDVNLPYGRTWALYRELRELTELAAVPVVLTTANEDAAREYTGDDVIELLLKPYDIRKFLDAVGQAVGPAQRPDRPPPARAARGGPQGQGAPEH